ncbi:MAG: tetratricopeptide repeat protein [Lachnospiraceae bacterium]|nr:tetratricopeptide repeat protein [Lachnospiraceae bacterium]
MANYDYKIKFQELKNLWDARDFEEAAKLADTIYWEKVNKVKLLCNGSDVYRKVKRYEDSIRLLEMANEQNPDSKEINYSLCELYIKTDNLIAARECYKTFLRIAPRDERRYLLQYLIYVMQDVRLEERVEVLEEYKSRAFRPKWVYELANLYHRLGLDTKCVEICDELFITEGDGKYVCQALELKKSVHAPLNAAQQAVLDRRFAPEGASFPDPVPVPEEPAYGPGSSHPGDRRIYAYEAPAAPAEGYDVNGKTREIPPVNASGEESNLPEITPEEQEAADALGQTRIFSAVHPDEIQIPQVNVGEYNTMDLQRALAQDVQGYLGDEEETPGDAVTKAILSPMLENTDSMDLPDLEDPTESEIRESLGNESEAPAREDYGDAGDAGPDSDLQELTVEGSRPVQTRSEVFFGSTGEIGDVAPKTVFPEGKGPGTRDVTSTLKDPLTPEELEAARERSQVRSEALSAQPPEEIAEVLTQEADGQIGLVMPENPVLTKQITGQLTIEDIMLEWERMKKESEDRNRQQYHEKVKEQTGKMFTAFEQAVLNDVYERIGKETHEDVEQERAARMERAKPHGNRVVEPEEEAYPDEITPEDQVEELAEIEGEGVYDAPEGEEYYDEGYDENDDGTYVEDEVFFDQETGEEYAPEDAGDASATEEEGYEEEYASGEEYVPEESGEYEEPAAEEEELPEVEIYQEPEETYAEETAQEAEAQEEVPAEEEAPQDDIAARAAAADDTTNEMSLEERIEARAVSDMANRPEPENGASRQLSDEERERFGSYIQTKLARRQLTETLDCVSMAPYTGNVIISGDEGTDMLTLATGILQEVKESDGNFTGKVAKITGANLDSDKVEQTLIHLANGGLIITEASQMSPETVAELTRLLERESPGIVVVLTDHHRPLRELMHQYPDLSRSFNGFVEVKAMSDKELMDFGKKYAAMRKCSISEMGVLALATAIHSLQTNDHAVTVSEVVEMIDGAIAHAKRKSPGNLFGGMTKKRYDEDGLLILKEKDFQ